METDKKIALITGATKGIGKGIALKLAACHYDLFIVGRDQNALKTVSQEIGALGVNCAFKAIDLSLPESPELVVAAVIKTYGQLDLVVNNAGYASAKTVSETSLDLWNKTFAINARAPFFICQAAVKYLQKSSRPIIINISSVVGFKGYANQAVYSSSKHALTGFTKVLAKEVQPLGIQVHLISPGGVNTEMVQEMRPDIDTSQLIQVEEIADIVEFIVTRKGRGTIDHFYIRRASGLPFD